MSKVHVVIVRPGKAPEATDIEHSLEAVQAIVGGFLEELPAKALVGYYALCNEDGVKENLPFNVTLQGYGVRGPLVVMKTAGAEWASLSAEDVHHVTETVRAARLSAS